MSSFETLTFEEKDGIGTLTINRPQALNALNAQVLGELKRFAESHKKTSLRALILTGSGEKAFVAGADIKEMESMTETQALEFARQGQRTFDAIEAIGCPVIAAVNGFALGGGMELALSCDVILASDKAKFGLPEVTLGLLPAFGGTQRLARAVGRYKAKELIFSGNFVGAEELRGLGLVSKVCAPAELINEANALAQVIATRAPLAIAAAKTAIDDGFDRLLKDGLEIEVKAFAQLFNTADQKEGTSAFVAKRKPEFKGR